MSRPSKSRSAKSAGLRKYRQKMIMDKTVVAGDPAMKEVVYCYRFPSYPERVKIGYSSRGLARVTDQSTAFPERPELVFIIHNERAKTIEKAFHEALSDRQSDVMGTEWFDAGWPEFLRVSPILRKASGRLGRQVWIRRMVLYTTIIACLLLYPPLALTQMALFDNLPMSFVTRIWVDYFTILKGANIADLGRAIRHITGAAFEYPAPALLKTLPFIIAMSPLVPLLVLRKKQAY